MVQEYTGSTCVDYLKQCSRSQASSDGERNQTLKICMEPEQGSSQAEIDGLLTSAKQGLDIFRPSEPCKKQLLPLVCLYYFPLVISHSEDENRPKTLQPSREECLNLKDNVCQDIWQTVERLSSLISIKLPDCDTLPQDSQANVLTSCGGK